VSTILVPIDLVQAAIIAKLKADTALTAWLTARGAADEIREVYWQGVDFVYPAIRLSMGTETATGNPPCTGTIPFTVLGFTEGDSSKLADELSGLIVAALEGKQLSGSGWRAGTIINDSIVHAARTGQRVWRSMSTYRVMVYYDS